MPNPGTKGFPLLSGLGELFSKEVLLLYSSKKKIEKRDFVPWCLRGKAKKEGMIYVVKFSEKNVLLCEVHKNGVL